MYLAIKPRLLPGDIIRINSYCYIFLAHVLRFSSSRLSALYSLELCSVQIQCLFYIALTATGHVMIAQWENKCRSLSVLSMVRVMIAQWENKCYSLSDLSMALVMIAQWENECISLSTLSVAWVMIAQWENKCHRLSSLWPEFNSRQWQGISREFSLSDHTLPTFSEPALAARQKIPQSRLSGTTQPVKIEEEG